MATPRIPFDHALPLVAREAFTLNGAKVEAGARVAGLQVHDAWTLWRTLKVDCLPPAVAVEPPPVPPATPVAMVWPAAAPIAAPLPKPAKPSGRRAGV